jgi:hypothetical protein
MCAEDDESDQDTGYDQGGRNTQPGPSQVRKQHDNGESDAQREQLTQAFRLPQARQRDTAAHKKAPAARFLAVVPAALGGGAVSRVAPRVSPRRVRRCHSCAVSANPG